ncbi:hypothetical protein BUALT_Bualt13G0010600 [Buddleja alternifolia]|uniref:RING-type E3 ubiquitin transferase n=1 Tax=Buddleja alternifolia TaxID=168488 RepID=A0AAV6WP65_9LAMI|nr:hypothetical protein BUALT_Bualt13G0010600 [Buddleja alternifolia]
MDWLNTISVKGIVCCLGAASCHLISVGCDSFAEALKSVTRVKNLKDLAPLLNAGKKVLPLVVAVSGRVGSDTPIKCEYSGLQGEILENRDEHHFLKHNDQGKWVENSTLSPSTWTEVSWYLVRLGFALFPIPSGMLHLAEVITVNMVLDSLAVQPKYDTDDGTGRVIVSGARGELALTRTCRRVFEKSGESPDPKELEERGLKMLGVQKIVRIQPIGKSLTVIGEAVKDHTGTILIQKPRGGPFCVSDRTVSQLIEDYQGLSSFCEYAAMGLTMVGTCLLAEHAFKYIMKRCRLLEMRRRLRAAAAGQAQQEEGLSGEAENRSYMMDRYLCKICLQQDYNSVFVPCGHMCCCLACAQDLNTCPVCRASINQILKTYRS